MKHKNHQRRFLSTLSILLALSILLTACRSSANEDTNENSSESVKTQAAEIAAESLIRTMAASSPTPSPVTPTLTSNPESATPSPTPPPTATLAPGAPTLPPGGDKAEFVLDVTVPDGTVFAPNANFVKTWRLKNIGTTTWTTQYSVVFTGGDQMGAPASILLPAQVPPGQTVDVSVPMVAPAQEGTYTGNYLLVNANGQRFGLPPNGISPFYVIIVVAPGGTPGSTTTPTQSTPGVTSTPGTGGAVVDRIFLQVDSGQATQCPHTFNLTGTITLKTPAIITYILDVNSFNPAVVVTPQSPVTVNLPAGDTILNFALPFSAPFYGQAILHVTAPENVLSNPVTLNLACVYP